MSTAIQEHVKIEAIPDIYVPRSVVVAILSSNSKRVGKLRTEGRLRTRRCPGGQEKLSLRDALGLLNG